VPLLRVSGRGLADLSAAGGLSTALSKQMLFQMSQNASPAEARSWDASLGVLAADLMDAGLQDVEVLVEHPLPLTSKRVDAILAGKHPRTGQGSYVLIELKQWSSVQPYDGDGELVAVDGYHGHPSLHPVAQVRGYGEYLSDFTRVFHDRPDSLAGAAYLHNAVDNQVASLFDYPRDQLGQLFTGQQRGQFLEFLQSRLAPEPGAPYADQFLNSGIAPSKELLAVAADEIRVREQFVLLDEQRIAFDIVLHEVEKARGGDHKAVVIVSGGPGSGKSVIALSLLGELSRRGRTAVHATGSRSFTHTLRKVAGDRAPRVRSLFKYFNSFIDAERNGLDVLIADEAHRVRETSADRWTKASLRTGKAQIDELIDAARVPVFLLDEHQVVRPGELGNVNDIEKAARARGLDVHTVNLNAQFRCGGSDSYLEWVERLLGLRIGGPTRWHGDPRFTVAVAETPSALEATLAAKLAEHRGARMAAGYCWPWSDPRTDGSLVPDVSIGDWSRPWNLKGDRASGGAPPAALWASDPTGFGQVGCVYTAQGFEYDWNGVIIGPDLVWRGDGWVTVRAANKDPDFRNRTKVDDLEFGRLVRNVYKVLLTRGLSGTIIYATDEETRDKLRELVG